MRSSRLTVVLAVFGLVTCAGGSLAQSPTPVEPTVLSGEQIQRDRALVPLAESIVDAYPNWNGFFSSLVANWSPDGKRILFGSLRDGLPEIYESEADKPAGRATHVTDGPERSVWAQYTPDGKYILFSAM